ncbi:MAG: ATP synthase subunit C [Gammaproteobacteria bacterium]|nr:ATP synthase subunit C [Gammaproteobacteria bacterium]
MNHPKKHNRFWLFTATAIISLSLLALPTLLLWAPQVLAAGDSQSPPGADIYKWAFIAAAAATSISCIAAAYAVANVGSAGIGAMTEKPELFGRVLVMVGLAEGIAIYGLIISILILNYLG